MTQFGRSRMQIVVLRSFPILDFGVDTETGQRAWPRSLTRFPEISKLVLLPCNRAEKD